MTVDQPAPHIAPSTPRGHLATEQRLASAAAIDALSIEAALRLINTQDLQVPQAVRQAIPALTALIQDIVAGMRQGGRLIYCGAGTSGRLGVLDASECPPTFCTEPGQVVGFIAGGDGALRVAVEGAEDDRTARHPSSTGWAWASTTRWSASRRGGPHPTSGARSGTPGGAARPRRYSPACR